MRKYLGLPTDNVAAILDSSAVSDEKIPALKTLMSWLYGQRSEPTVIRSQNPDLNRLVEVLGNDNARTMLEANRDLDAAYGQVEDKSLKFSEMVMTTIKNAEDALSLVGNFDGRADLMNAGDNLRRTIVSLHKAMRNARYRAETGEEEDAD